MTDEWFVPGPDGTRLYVRRRACADVAAPVTAVLCDGIACDGFIWKYLFDELAQRLNVVHYNYRGHGRSSMPSDPTRIELTDHVEDLQAVRAAVDDPPVVLFGHSMGCQVVLEACRKYSHNVRGLVLLCGASGRVTYSFKGTDVLAQMLPRLIEQVDAHPHISRALWGHVPPEAAFRIARLTGDIDSDLIPLEDFAPYLRHMVDIDLPMFLRMLRSAGEHSAADILPSIDVPALVVAGDKDTFTPPRYAEEMAAALPQGELLVAPGTHVAPIEQKELVNGRIWQFLERKLDVAPPESS